MTENNTEKNLCGEKFLADCVRDYKIFIDSCSLLSPSAGAFWRNIIPILKAAKKTVIVPWRAYQEVKRFAEAPELCARRSPDNPELHTLAQKAEITVLKLHNAGLVEIFGDKDDNFADNVFQTVFTKFRMKYNLLLITQDRDLAADILRIGESKAVMTDKRILVRKLTGTGYLNMIALPKPEKHTGPGRPAVARRMEHIPSQESAGPPENEVFAVADRVAVPPACKIASVCPGEEDTVTAQRGPDRRPVRLVRALSSGGEGTIYTTDLPGVVAKIYKPGKADGAKVARLQRMITKNIRCPGVCFPVAVLYDSGGGFVGCLMPEAKGKNLQTSVFIPALLKKNFPDWQKKDTVRLSVTILEKLKYLHDRNIILGDINPGNILVVSPTEVYFVDTDSYQIEGYPCPVGTVNFTAPEIQRKRFDTFLRTAGNERFAVATLLFMLMLPGKPPYSLQGGENQIDNIMNGDFAYASGERSNGKAPDGTWRYMWSHMPRFLKDDFYETFRKGGLQSTEATRFSDADWLRKFRRYEALLADPEGKFLTNDRMSADLFPTRLKKDINTTYVTCSLCGREVDEEKTEQGICRDCLQAGETYACAGCGKEMVYTNYRKYIRRAPKKEVCQDCRDKVRQKILCPGCGHTFNLTYGEAEFYREKGWKLPKKCPTCRTAKPTTRKTPATPRTAPTPSKHSSLCFITTAVCDYFQKPDDCYELTTLRRFRDDWLALQPGGKAIIAEYYRIAPLIVAAIDASPEKDRVYRRIRQDYIEPCIALIELGANEPCRALYTEMVNELKKIYIKEENTGE